MSSIRQKTETIQPVIIGLKARLSIRELTSASALALIVFTMSWAANGVSGDTLWSAHVEPLLKEHCAECHNPTKAKSGLNLTSLQAILRGGERGAAVIPGRPDDSHIYTALFAGADPHMPPGNRKKLSDEEAALIRRWIEKLGTANTQNVTNWSETTYASVAVKRRITWEPPADMPASKAVDRFLELAWKLEKVTPAARASDRAFVRRVHLDLFGRVPTREQTEDFLADRRRDKRARLIDALLANDDYARHMREIFDPVLMERRDSKWEEQREKQKWFGWIEDQFKRNRPWNEVVRDVIVARPTQPEDRGAVWFLYERENNPQAVAEALAPIVFGVQVKCAQCHDHMVAREIKQAHYWGMVAAFNRSKNVDTPAGPGVAESAIGGFVSFANLKKESQPARLVFFNGRTVDEPWPKEGEKEQDSPDLYLVPPTGTGTAEAQESKPQRRRRQSVAKADQPAVPKFSRREAFADAVTRDNPLLARAMVNRVWAMLFGRGLVHRAHPDTTTETGLVQLAPPKEEAADDYEKPCFGGASYTSPVVLSGCALVHPVDLMDSKHPSSQPELLEWLARDFESSGYDVKRLVRTLCNTRVYQLDSRPAKGTKPGVAGTFAHALDKPLSAEQLFRSLLIATGTQADTNGLLAGKLETELRRAFIKEFPALFPEEYNATLQQAMFLSNSGLFDHLLTPREGNLIERLAGLAEHPAQVREAFLSVFAREPDNEEMRECGSYLRGRSPEAGVKQMLWAMLTSAEFQLNH